MHKAHNQKKKQNLVRNKNRKPQHEPNQDIYQPELRKIYTLLTNFYHPSNNLTHAYK